MVSLVCEGDETGLIIIDTKSPEITIVPSFFLYPRLVSTGIETSSAETNKRLEPILWRLGTQELIGV